MPSSWERSWVNLGLKEAEGDVGEGRAAERERRTCSDHSTLRGNRNDGLTVQSVRESRCLGQTSSCHQTLHFLIENVTYHHSESGFLKLHLVIFACFSGCFCTPSLCLVTCVLSRKGSTHRLLYPQ